MNLPVRHVLVQRLEELGEFEERLNDSSMTQYKRKQALKENLPADFVKERREEIESKWLTHALMLVGVLIFPLIILGDYLWLAPETFTFGWKIGIAGVTAVVFVIAGVYCIRGLVNYYRRREIYTVLHDLDQASEDVASTEHTESSVSAQNREPVGSG
jgi:uncharacterized membrane protein (DUF485 family)